MTDKEVRARFAELDKRATVVFNQRPSDEKLLYFCLYVKDGEAHLTRPTTDLDLALDYGKLCHDSLPEETEIQFYIAGEGRLRWGSLDYGRFMAEREVRVINERA